MNLAEAMALAEAGERVTCDQLQPGAVLTLSEGWDARLRVLWEATGDGYDFTPNERFEAAEWRLVSGWASYG